MIQCQGEGRVLGEREGGLRLVQGLSNKGYKEYRNRVMEGTSEEPQRLEEHSRESEDYNGRKCGVSDPQHQKIKIKKKLSCRTQVLNDRYSVTNLVLCNNKNIC